MPNQPDRTFDLDSLWGIDLRPDPAWEEQKARLWAMTRDERVRAMRAGRLSMRLCLHAEALEHSRNLRHVYSVHQDHGIRPVLDQELWRDDQLSRPRHELAVLVRVDVDDIVDRIGELQRSQE